MTKQDARSLVVGDKITDGRYTFRVQQQAGEVLHQISPGVVGVALRREHSKGTAIPLYALKRFQRTKESTRKGRRGA